MGSSRRDLFISTMLVVQHVVFHKFLFSSVYSSISFLRHLTPSLLPLRIEPSVTFHTTLNHLSFDLVRRGQHQHTFFVYKFRFSIFCHQPPPPFPCIYCSSKLGERLSLLSTPFVYSKEYIGSAARGCSIRLSVI